MKAILIGYDSVEEIDLEANEDGSTYKQIGKIVGSPFDVFGALYDGISLYVDDDGMSNQPPNRAVYANAEMAEAGYLRYPMFTTSFRSGPSAVREGDLYTVLHGPILAIGYDPATGEDRDLTDAEAARVMRDFGPDSPMGPGSGADAWLEVKLARMLA